ncbi:Hypothetical protein A7982_00753 [Minicystis rosea]|nr:Hypothetical protein A7982_00753 [Minicystis rosea]
MARKPELAELTTRLAMQALGSEGRHKRILVFGGIGVVVLGVGVFIAAKTIDTRDAAAREETFGALSTCLLGADALKPDETPSARVANVKLGVVGIPAEKRTKAGESPWPVNCATHAYSLKEHAGDTPLAAAAEALAKALKADVSASADLHNEIDHLFTEATTAKLKATPPPNAVAGPKPAAVLFTHEQFKGLPKVLSGGFSVANIRESGAHLNKLHFLVDQKDSPEGPVVCTVNAADPTIKCQKVPEAVATLSPGLRLVGSTEDGARPFFFAGDRGQLGIFPSDGRHAIAATVAYGAAARSDGSIVFATRKDGAKDIRVVHQPAVGPTTDQSILQPTDVDSPAQLALAFDWLVNRSIAKQGTASHLFARKIDGARVLPAVDVGELDEKAPEEKADRDASQVALCKSDEALAVRVRGQRNDAVAFFAGGRWASPVKATTHGGAFTCRGLEAFSTTVDHVAGGDKDFPVVTQAKCNTSGCTTTRVEMRQLLAGMGEIAPTDASGSVAADVGGKLMIVWNAGLAGGLRMRFAPADKMKEAEDIVITDGRDEKTTVSSIAQLRVLTTNNYAVLLLSTTSGVKALKVDSTGKLTPMAASM